MAAGQLRLHRRMAADRPPCGYEWFLTQKISWNDTTKFPHHSFMWEGIDGSRIFTHFPPADTYAAWCKVQELDYAEKNFQDKDLVDRSLLSSVSVMRGRPHAQHDGAPAPLREPRSVSKVSVEEPNDFFDKAHRQLAENAGPEMPVWKGELYLELHRGTLTSQQGMKRGCRQEESLLRTVEYLARPPRWPTRTTPIRAKSWTVSGRP